MKRSTSVAAAMVAAAAGSTAGAATPVVPVEQIEASEATTSTSPPSQYAAVSFGGSSTYTAGNGSDGNVFNNITFHAVPYNASTATFSNHAYTVGENFYGSSSPAYGSVANVYATEANAFLNTIGLYTAPSSGEALPGSFAGGALVVNSSYVATYLPSYPQYPGLDLDAQRRIDYAVAAVDTTFVAAAVTTINGGSTYNDLVWSGFDTLDVSGVQNGSQSFAPTPAATTTIGGITRPVGKTHADLTLPGQDASFAAAITSGYAAALIAAGQTAGQTDVNHGVVVRSLLMAGADKTYQPAPGQVASAYTRQTANNLDVVRGAGVPDYANSLSILNAGEKALVPYAAGGVAATPATTSRGWVEGAVTSGTQSVLLVTAANAITGVTASLNWDDTETTGTYQNPGGSLYTGVDSTDAGVTFPTLTLELRPVTLTAGKYVLGASLGNANLSSSVTGDTVQYLYSTGTLPAGTYALLVTGDATYKPALGLSYLLNGTFASAWNRSTGSSWNTASNWTNGLPNAQAAVATFGANPGLTAPGTVTLDGNQTVGRLTFANANGYTIAPGTGGVLTFDDTGDSSGTNAPSVVVTLGSHTVTAPVVLTAGLAVNVSSGSAFSLAGTVTGTGNLTKSGAGSLVLGTAVISLPGDLTVAAGTVTCAANNTSTALVRSVGNLNVAGGTLVIAPSPAISILTAASLTFGGTVSAPVGKLDVGNGDLIVHNGNLAALTTAAAAGYAGGPAGPAGLTSVTAAADAKHLTAIGVIPTPSGTTTFDGQSVISTDVLVKYTYFGDANLDGVVDGQDYARTDAGFLSKGALTGWANGDFNYDGKVNASDYTLIDNAFNLQGTSLTAPAVGLVAAATAEVSAAPPTAVPEPAAIGIAALAAVGVLGRRRRRNC